MFSSFPMGAQNVNAEVYNKTNEYCKRIQKHHDHNNHNRAYGTIEYIVPSKIAHEKTKSNGSNDTKHGGYDSTRAEELPPFCGGWSISVNKCKRKEDKASDNHPSS